MEHLLDPNADPYQWLWDALEPLTSSAILSGLQGAVPEPLQQLLLNPAARSTIPLVGLLVLGLVLMHAGGRRGDRPRPRADAAEPVYEGALQMGLGVWRGLWWRVRFIPRAYRWQVGAYRISTRRKHAGIVGATGSRKSTLAAELVDGARPTLILTGEPSDPLRDAVFRLAAHGKGIYWSPDGAVGWDMLEGDPMETAERLTAGTKKSEQDTGLGRGIVQDAIYHALNAADRLGEPRRWELVDEALQLLLRSARDTDTVSAAKRWLQRFNHMRLALDAALGQDLDLAAALAAGQTVMMEMSSMRSPESTPLVAANILLDGKRAAQLVRGGRLIVDEGWAFKERKGEIGELVRAGRRLGWEVFFLTQLPQDYTDEMLGNFRTWVFLMQVGANTAALDWCSKAVHRKLPPEAFSEGVLDEGDGWLLTGGRLVKVHVPWRKSGMVPQEWSREGGTPAAAHQGGNEGGSVGTMARDAAGGTTIWEADEDLVELSEAQEAWSLLPPPSSRVRALPIPGKPSPPDYYACDPERAAMFYKLEGTWEPNACWRWPGGTNGKGGRAKPWFQGKNHTGYVLTCTWRNGPPPLDMDTPEVDHRCHNQDLHCPGGATCQHRLCMNGDHHAWVPRQVNRARMEVHKAWRKRLLAGLPLPDMTVEQGAELWLKERAAAERWPSQRKAPARTR